MYRMTVDWPQPGLREAVGAGRKRGQAGTAAFLESILRHARFRTGLNTSPHLEKINERIRVDGEEISDADFADVLTRIQTVTEELLAEGKLRAHPTYFECVTAMAFQYFLCLDAVLIGVHLKVDVVQQPNNAPLVLLTLAQQPCKVA